MLYLFNFRISSKLLLIILFFQTNLIEPMSFSNLPMIGSVYSSGLYAWNTFSEDQKLGFAATAVGIFIFYRRWNTQESAFKKAKKAEETAKKTVADTERWRGNDNLYHYYTWLRMYKGEVQPEFRERIYYGFPFLEKNFFEVILTGCRKLQIPEIVISFESSKDNKKTISYYHGKEGDSNKHVWKDTPRYQ